jgi:UDP-N-acetylglucosamine--N-acetylmuramyl-(pentapeptide) pyrophosphoryl-undecaprenol N-acetylglucosamine transferase
MSPVRDYGGVVRRRDGGSKGMSSVPSGAHRVLIASGASAGHLYPALAFAQGLASKRDGIEIAFVSSRRRGIENCIKEAGYPLFFISVCQFNLNLLKFLESAYRLTRSFLESFLIIRRFNPDIVVGFGSYVSFPVLFEAAVLGKATLIHEQNTHLGLANRILSHFVDKTAISFREMYPSSSKFVFTGNPLRRSLFIEDKEKARRFFNLGDVFTILGVGGSQGSHKINTAFKDAVKILVNKNEGFQFIHLSGNTDYLHLKDQYKYITIKHRLFDFFADMHLAYSLADLVVCRAGAGTLSELAYFGKAAILIPYPYAGGHQAKNAKFLKRENAALVIEERALSGEVLGAKISHLMRSSDERKTLEVNIRKFAIADAGDRLAELTLSLIR